MTIHLEFVLNTAWLALMLVMAFSLALYAGVLVLVKGWISHLHDDAKHIGQFTTSKVPIVKHA